MSSSTGSSGASTGTESSTATATTGAAECNPVPEEVKALQACGLASPCGGLYDYSNAGQSCVGSLEGGDPYAAADLCALDVLATRKPGVLQASWSCPDVVTERYVYVVGEVAYVTRSSGGPCFGCEPCDWSESWSAVERCQLRPAADFTACASAADAASRVACMDPTQWFTSCEVAAPACAP